MVDETTELPVAEEPTKTAKEEPKQNVDELLAELEKAGISEPQQLQGKLDASREAGKAFQMLGDERERGRQLQAELDKLKAQPKEQDWDAYPEGKPIDIEAAIERSIDKSITKREMAARQAQQASIDAYTTIKTDPNYKLVEDVWNERIKDPAYIYQVQTGQVNPVMDYQQTVVTYFQNMAKKSYETIKELTGAGTKPSPPHVESGETRSPANIVSTDAAVPESVQKMRELKAKTEKGYLPTEDDELAVIDTIFASMPE